MTRDEARRIISIWLEWLEESKDLDGQRGYIEGHFNEEDVEAFRMAIEALSQPIVCKDYCIDDDHIYCSPKMAERVVEALHADRPSGEWLPFEDIAQMMSTLFGECACDVNGNDEWLPQACKYAETECPHPKEKNGCWMQFLMQGGADMRGGDNEAD